MKHFALCLSALCALVITGCSGSSTKLLELVPDGSDMVAVVDAEAVLESAGGRIENARIVLPKYVTDVLSDSKLDRIEPLLDAGCVDLSSIVVGGNYEDDMNFCLFAVKDAEKFRKLLRECDLEKESSKDDYACYATAGRWSRDYVVTGNGLCVIYLQVDAADEFNAIRATTRMFEKAKKASFADTRFAKHLSGHTAACVARIPAEVFDSGELASLPVPQAVRKASAFAYADLNDDELTAHVGLLDRDAKPVDLTSFMPKSVKFKPTTVNTRALKFFGNDVVAAYAMSLKDVEWDVVFEELAKQMPRSGERTMLAAIEPYVSNIDGTVAVGFGPLNGLTTFKTIGSRGYRGGSPLDQFVITAVVETRDGKAKSMLRQLQSLAEGFNVKVEEADSGIALPLDSKTRLYVDAKGDFLVLSTMEISDKGGSAVSSLKWGDWFVGLGGALDEKSPIMRDLELRGYSVSAEVACKSPYGIDLRLSCKGGNERGLIERIAVAAMNVADNGNIAF